MQKLIQRYRYSAILLKQLVKTDFKLRYKGSALGYVWSLLRPLALFAILYVVFVHFLKVGADIPHYAVYLLLGVVLWNYFVEVTNNGLSSVVGKGDLMRKLSFPRYIVVLSGAFSALINLGLNLVVVAIFLIANGVGLQWSDLLIIPLIIELFIFALGVSFLLAALYVRFRDVNYVWEVVLQAGFYATPILYPITLVAVSAPAIAKLMMLSPIAQVVQDTRYLIVTDKATTLGSLYHNYAVYLIPVGIVILLTTAAAVYFRQRSPYFAEEI